MISSSSSLFTKENPLLLASESPQRMQILEIMDIPFRAVASDFEEIIDPKFSPEENAKRLATKKAQSVLRKFPDSFVVGVDTLVVSAVGEILEKPKDASEARKMIEGKSGKRELIISGICLLAPNREIVRHEVSEVFFSELSKEDVEKIVHLGEWEGKSGGIAVTGKSGVYIEKIVGNLWNIIGFPIPTFLEMLREIK